MKQLYVQTINAVWQNADQNTTLQRGTIHIWRVKISAHVVDLSCLQALLEPAETAKIQRYRQEKDRQTRIISRAVLRILLGKYLTADPTSIRFKLDENKKPVIQNVNPENLHFNVSHSGDWILIGIATNPLGVDVEQFDASFTDQNLLDFSFSLLEKNFIQSAPNPVKSFYQLWTKKEALLKATGKGLTDNLPQVPSLDGRHQCPNLIIGSEKSWQITSFHIDENHVGSAAFMPVKTALQLFNFQL